MRYEPTEEQVREIFGNKLFMEKIKLADDAANRYMWGKADQSKPNDFIKLTHPEMEKLEQLWTRFLPDDSEFKDKALVPADLILAGTIPLTDMILEMDLDSDDRFYRFRIVIFEDYKEVIEKELNDLDDESSIVVGLVIRQFTEPGTGNEIGLPITVSKNENYINNIQRMYYRGVPAGMKQDAIPQGLAFLLQSGALGVWYGIQLALLNPITKEAFAKCGKEKIKDYIPDEAKKNAYRKGATRYIKKIKLHEENFNKLLNGTGNSRERHTLAWRVIGHWRHYKNGRTIFIKPYWKGVFRDIQKADCRNREIVTE